MAEWVFRPKDALRVIGYLSNHVQKLPDREYKLEVKEHRKKRSLDANAYFWVVCGKVAAAMSITKNEVYQNCIRDIGGVSTTGCFQDEDVPELCRLWGCKGLGWMTDTFPSKIEGCTNIIFYKGSSEYDTKQMSDLISCIIQDAQALGIETLTPQEQERMLDAWAR